MRFIVLLTRYRPTWALCSILGIALLIKPDRLQGRLLQAVVIFS